MEFQVPKFLRREAKIIGPLTFKQIIYFGIGVLILVIAYYLLPKTIFFVFLIIVGGGIGGMIFIKIDGVPLNEAIVYYIDFLYAPKSYFWQKREHKTPIAKLITSKRQTTKEKTPILKLSPESKLSKLGKKVEFGGE